jgi:hypothetical protein
MNNLNKEIDLYKDLKKNELKKVIRQYKFLSFTNSELFYFLYTFLICGLVFFFFVEISLKNVFVLVLFHYIFMWELIYNLTKFRSTDKKEKKEIDQIIHTLEKYLKDKN